MANVMSAMPLLTLRKPELPDRASTSAVSNRGSTRFRDSLMEATNRRTEDSPRENTSRPVERRQADRSHEDKAVQNKNINSKQHLKKAIMKALNGSKPETDAVDETEAAKDGQETVQTNETVKDPTLEDLIKLLETLGSAETTDNEGQEGKLPTDDLMKKVEDILKTLGIYTTKLDALEPKDIQNAIAQVKDMIQSAGSQTEKAELKAAETLLKDVRKIIQTADNKNISFEDLVGRLKEAYEQTAANSGNMKEAAAMTQIQQQTELQTGKTEKTERTEKSAEVETAAIEQPQTKQEVKPKEKKDSNQPEDDSIKTSDLHEKTEVKADKEAIREKGSKVVEQDHKHSEKPLVVKDKMGNSVVIIKDSNETGNKFEMTANAKIEKPVVVTKGEIINQIVKKAAVIVNEGQSEMQMKLEPESLGKLSLKVVVEKGLVTAKFIAESQQVKEVIETNFNQLKDLLQEKGIGVQSFSVSVGQDNSNPNYKQAFATWKESMRENNRSFSGVSGTGSGSVETYETKASNPYSYHDGSVDFKA